MKYKSGDSFQRGVSPLFTCVRERKDKNREMRDRNEGIKKYKKQVYICLYRLGGGDIIL